MMPFSLCVCCVRCVHSLCFSIRLCAKCTLYFTRLLHELGILAHITFSVSSVLNPVCMCVCVCVCVCVAVLLCFVVFVSCFSSVVALFSLFVLALSFCPSSNDVLDSNTHRQMHIYTYTHTHIHTYTSTEQCRVLREKFGVNTYTIIHTHTHTLTHSHTLTHTHTLT